MAHPGDERALPADAMLDSDFVAADGSATSYADDDIDVIRLMQERDAYRLETEKLRKIIERQRFIIKSLQDQISRKQSGSSANTPTIRSSELLPDSMEHLPQAAALAAADKTLSASVASSVDGRIPSTSAAITTQTAFPNALGLSSLTAASQQNSTHAQRNISQGSFNAHLVPMDDRGSAEMALASANQRPWAKSTRLSEIYADYSARHNSVVPMFKSDASPAQQMQSAAPAHASSFVDSLKASINKSEWTGEWNNRTEHDYSTDRLNDRRISSLILDSSREPSMSLDIEDRADILLDSQPERTFLAKPGTTSSTAASREYRSPASIGRDDNFSIYANASLASPSVAPPNNQDSQPGQTASELLVLRPMSPLADHDSPSHLQNGPAVSDARESFVDEVSNKNDNDGYEWREAALSGYEYGGSSVDRPRGRDEHSLQNDWSGREGSQNLKQQAQSPPPQQQQAPRQDEPQKQHALYQQQQQQLHASSPPFEPNTESPASVRLEPMASIATSSPMSTNAMPVRGDSAAFGSELQPLSEPAARSLRGVPSPGASSDYHQQSAVTDHDSHSHHEVSAIPAPLGAIATHSNTTDSYKHPLQPPLTSLRNIDIQIKDSRVKIDERGKEVNVYMIDIVHRREISGLSLQEILIESQQSQAVLWTVEKRYSDFLNLNSQLQHVVYIERLVDKLERLPEKEIFRANAPTKNDKRKHWFEKYLKKALSMSFKDKRPLIEFLSTDCTMEPEKKMPILLGHKEGFLVKKGKNFGGWKRRYYVCKSNQPVLEYFEMPGSTVMGTINLSGAVVKTGKTPKEVPNARARPGHKEADIFRHAFLIEERPKREGKEPIAHPLWADSDRERDEWVTALRYVIVRDAEGPERAMEEVARYASYAKSKESNLLMIQQIQTSITHEHGARRSIEYNRRREEQRHATGTAAGTAAGLPTIDEADTRQTALHKAGSPLSKQVWPITASLGNLTHHGAGSADSPVDSPASIKPAVNGSAHALKYSRGRPRSLSLPPIQDGEGGSAPAIPRPDTSTSSARQSPAIIAATLSTSFTGQNDSLANQAECMSVHYVPSEISTIESSIYSSYNGHDGSQRLNDISSRSIGDGNSYASEPDSPVSPRGAVDRNVTQLVGRKLVSNYPSDSASSVSHPPPSYESNAGSFPDMAHYNRYLGEQATHGAQPADGKPRAQFTKDSVGRIVREEEHAPDLPKFTPHVTDDILGVGRQDPSIGEGSSHSALSSIFNGGRTRTREEKKRGRITFMWGKRKPTDENILPDMASPGGSSSSSTGPYGGGLDTPPVPAPRRLRRGSTNNDSRNHLSKQGAFRGPVFGLPLEAVVEQTKIREHYHLPAVVYRCIEFLDTKKACMEEGIYRQSGSSLALNILRKEFNTNRDYNLLKLSRPPDVHAVASLLKAYLRELPESVLTTRLRQEFVRVVDLAERRDRVHELGRLVSELPLANYTLLRALTAHLIRIVQKASTNLMTLRNIGIVFSPSLGIPVGVFSLLMVEFEYIFWVNDSGAPEPRSLSVGSDGGAADLLKAHGASASASKKAGHMPDVPLSVSVPTGIDRMAGDDNLYSAGSNQGTDCHSPASDFTARPSRALENRPPAAVLRHVGSRHEIEGPRSQDNIQSTVPVASAPWFTQSDSEFSTGVDMPRDLSRYPDMPAPAAKTSQPQQQHRPVTSHQQTGRSNRNSIQYNVGAPRELILHEADIVVPATISEDDDDGLSTNCDPLMRLSRYASNHTLH
ncbi:Rho GTPase activating protein [Coemansia sp. BCRC 34962]|nr:Rho GTPase activating protein [Coemansia sp. BCRC 34962]